MSPFSVTLPGMAEKLRSKHFIFLNRNLEDTDLIKTMIPPVETETDQIDINAWGFIDVILIITNRS